MGMMIIAAALVGFCTLDMFHAVCVGSELVTIWVAGQTADSAHSYGYERQAVHNTRDSGKCIITCQT
jgi:hypothetical protein